jgi:glycosyltransferase involved in cell wall biosynthesis
MKLLCIAASYYPAFQFGGPVFSTHTLHKALIKKGIDVTVYTTNAGLRGNVTPNTLSIVDGVKIIYFSFTNVLEFTGATGWQYSRSMIHAIKKNLGEFDLVYIVAIWNAPAAIASWFCKKNKKFYIISPRGQLYPEVLKKKFFKKWLYYSLIAQRMLRGASAIHYTTLDEAQRCHGSLHLTNKTITIPHGIHLDEFMNLPSKDKLRERFPELRNKEVVLFLGRITWKKGLDILINAFVQSLKIRPNLHLLIAGTNDEGYLANVIAWIKQYNIEQHVTITGGLHGNEKKEAFAGSNLFVLPSYSENFGVAVVEALACGLPIIISNKVGIYNDVRDYNAGLVVNTNPESLHNAIVTLLNNAELQQTFVDNGKKLIRERYDINKVSLQMIEAFRHLVKNGDA